jgi:CHAT domain-containing protein
LHYVPFAALPIPSGEPTKPALVTRSDLPLVAKYEIVSLASASALAILRKETAGRKPAPRTLAVLADAVFQSDDPRTSEAGKLAHGGNGDSETAPPGRAQSLPDDLVRSAEQTGVISFPRLPFTRHEAETIVAEAGEDQSLKLLDFEAARDTLLNTDLSRYRIIHFATHGLLNSRHPQLSGIVLSLVDEHGRYKNGFLRTHDIYNMRLRADLVVLSACRTALGREIKGEGLVGLTRGFMHSGVASVVASLWDVKDEATSELMKRFYHNMLRRGLRPPAALRAAQVSLLNETRWQSPHHWAGFTLQGEWR